MKMLVAMGIGTAIRKNTLVPTPILTLTLNQTMMEMTTCLPREMGTDQGRGIQTLMNKGRWIVRAKGNTEGKFSEWKRST